MGRGFTQNSSKDGADPSLGTKTRPQLFLACYRDGNVLTFRRSSDGAIEVPDSCSFFLGLAGEKNSQLNFKQSWVEYQERGSCLLGTLVCYVGEREKCLVHPGLVWFGFSEVH